MTSTIPATPGRIHTVRDRTLHVVCCHGDLDSPTTTALRYVLGETYRTDPADLLVDTRAVTWAGSAALGVLTAAGRRASLQGHTLTLANPPLHLLRTLRTTGLHRVIRVTQVAHAPTGCALPLPDATGSGTPAASLVRRPSR